MRLKLFAIRFNGLYMGGKAIIKAKDESEALEILDKLQAGLTEKDKEIESIEKIKQSERVIHYENGDY